MGSPVILEMQIPVAQSQTEPSQAHMFIERPHFKTVMLYSPDCHRLK